MAFLYGSYICFQRKDLEKLRSVFRGLLRNKHHKGDHLNASGAERVSIYLAAYLKENYDLPDHRGEEAYASYTQMEKQYDRIVNEKIKEIRE